MTRRPLVAANLKMNLLRAEVSSLARSVREGIESMHGGRGAADPRAAAEVVICPSYASLASAREALEGSAIHLGAQNLHPEAKGAFTGEISGAMLRDAGCRYVIVGHSERRQLFGETDEIVGRKVRAALREDLFPILCVGETRDEREGGETIRVVDRQIDVALRDLSLADLLRLTVAYEPVWAIGTGLTPTVTEVAEVHSHLRGILRERSVDAAEGARILYGGSVTPGNAAELFRAPDVDGGLVGGASLRAETFVPIVEAAGNRA